MNQRYDDAHQDAAGGTGETARRKPAGKLLVVTLVVLIVASGIGVLLPASKTSLTPLIRVSTLWASCVSLGLGAVILVLGVMGRRAGGLVPMAWAAVVVTVGMLMASVSYGYVVNSVGMSGPIARTNGTRSYGDTAAQRRQLRSGVRFVGTRYDDVVTIDLTGSAWRVPHNAEFYDSGANPVMRRSDCPTGQLTISARQTRVIITMPRGCTFGFGNDSGSMSGVDAQGGRYHISRGLNDFGIDDWGWGVHDGMVDRASVYCTNDAAGIMRSAELPVNNPAELLIDVRYVVDGQVTVRYPGAKEEPCPAQWIIR